MGPHDNRLLTDRDEPITRRAATSRIETVLPPAFLMTAKRPSPVIVIENGRGPTPVTLVSTWYDAVLRYTISFDPPHATKEETPSAASAPPSGSGQTATVAAICRLSRSMTDTDPSVRLGTKASTPSVVTPAG